MLCQCVSIFSLLLISGLRVAEADVENSVDYLSPSPTIEINGERCYEALDRETVNITLKATRADPPNDDPESHLWDMFFLGPDRLPVTPSVLCLDDTPCLLQCEFNASDRTALNYRAAIFDKNGIRLDVNDLRVIVGEEKPLKFTCRPCFQKNSINNFLVIDADTEGYPSASVFILRDNDGNIIGNKTAAKKASFNIDLSGWDDVDVNFTLTAINRLDKSVNLPIEIPKQPKSLTDSSKKSRVAEADVANSVDYLSPSPMIEINGELCYEALDRELVHITLKATRADPPNADPDLCLADIFFVGPDKKPVTDSVRCLDGTPCFLEYELEAAAKNALIYTASIYDHPGTTLDYKNLRLIVGEEKPLKFTCSVCYLKNSINNFLVIDADTEGYPSASVFILRDNDGNIIGNKTAAKKVLFNIDLSDWDDADVNFTLTAINRRNKSVNLPIEITKQPKHSSTESASDAVDGKTIALAVALSVVLVVILVAVAVFFCRHKRSTRPVNRAGGEMPSFSDDTQITASMTIPDIEANPQEAPPSSGPTDSPHQQTSNPPSEEAQRQLPVNNNFITINNYIGQDSPRSEDVPEDSEGGNDSLINCRHAPKPRNETTLSSSLPSSVDTGSLEVDNMTEQYPGEHPEQRMEELKSHTATNGNQTVINVNETIESSDDGDDLEIDGAACVKTLSKPVQESGDSDKSSSTCINEDYQVKVHFDDENIDVREDSHDKVIT